MIHYKQILIMTFMFLYVDQMKLNNIYPFWIWLQWNLSDQATMFQDTTHPPFKQFTSMANRDRCFWTPRPTHHHKAYFPMVFFYDVASSDVLVFLIFILTNAVQCSPGPVWHSPGQASSPALAAAAQPANVCPIFLLPAGISKKNYICWHLMIYAQFFSPF